MNLYNEKVIWSTMTISYGHKTLYASEPIPWVGHSLSRSGSSDELLELLCSLLHGRLVLG